jgi:SAM-dependent methyltransferase
MPAVPSDRTSTFFDSYAADFDGIYGRRGGPLKRLVNRRFRRSMRERFALTVAGCDPAAGRTVIDVGCGPGYYAVTLASRGARVVGIDFAPAMIDLAVENAQTGGVADRCTFLVQDILDYQPPKPFDFAVVMGFMDYVAEPERLVRRVLDITRGRAFFSFPANRGFLAWQRRLRYRFKCDLFMYRREQIDRLMDQLGVTQYTIEDIHRDYFVTVNVSGENPTPAR